jgi:hypothetical protein
MQLLFLHGAPGAGKLTIARALSRLVPARLHDNHAAIDLARTIFDFGAPGFWELVHAVRLQALRAAVQHRVPLVIMTYCYVDPDDGPAFRDFEACVEEGGGRVMPVFLSCQRQEILRRLGNVDRIERGKITTPAAFDAFLAGLHITAVPRSDCFVLDSGQAEAEDTAQSIVRHFGL